MNPNEELQAMRDKAIQWINNQDIFRRKSLMEYMGNPDDEYSRYHIREVLRYATYNGYLEGLEKDQFVVVTKLPLGMRPHSSENFKKDKRILESKNFVTPK